MLHLRTASVAVLAALVLAGAGCADAFSSFHFKSGAAQPPPVASVEAWAPGAVAIGIHPATRITRKAEGRVVDVRVRMTDALGDYTKVSGQWLFELRGAANSGADLVASWREQVVSFEQHKAHFDAATRAYRFQLPLKENQGGGAGLKLFAIFTPDASSRRMASEAFEVSEK